MKNFSQLIMISLSLGLFQACQPNEDLNLKSSDQNPFCSLDATDENGDGWSYEDGQSCRIAPVCTDPSSDPDGDGWGWTGEQSCRVLDICSSAAENDDGDGYGWENNRSCLMAKPCQNADSDPDGDGWGYENGSSCVVVNSSKQRHKNDRQPSEDAGHTSGQLLEFETTYYPYENEHYFKTTCGDANNHGGFYFAVTEDSPLWAGVCDNESWADCYNDDCLSKWDRMPSDVKRVNQGRKQVREPRCKVPCGKKFRVYSDDMSRYHDAVIYDACPSQHWNNRFKEVTEGANPCAKGSMHVDLRKPLYLKLTNYERRGNIRVYIDSTPLN